METQDMVSAHLHLIEDKNGDVVDAVVFCSDWCHRTWCAGQPFEYGGWNGCHEMDGPQWCAFCENEL